jgi:hypothetical protein
MRTTVTLDDDVARAIEAERAARGETFKEALNRLVRRGLHPGPDAEAPPLPLLRGRPQVDVTDTSAVMADLDDERTLDRGGA